MSQRCLIVLFWVSVCLIFANSPFLYAQDDELENLLQNPGFEAEIGNAPWTLWVEGQAAGAGAMLSVVDDEIHTGEQSLLLDIFNKGNGQRVELHQNPIEVVKGQQLTYAFWAKTEPGGLVEGAMRMNHRADPWTTYGSGNVKIIDEWQEFWITANIPSDDLIAGIYIELKDSAEAMVWFDHFRLYDGEYFEEDEEGNPKISVEPNGRLLSTWAGVKSVF